MLGLHSRSSIRPRYLFKLNPFGQPHSLNDDLSLAIGCLHVHLMLINIDPYAQTFARTHLHLCFESQQVLMVVSAAIQREPIDDISDLDLINRCVLLGQDVDIWIGVLLRICLIQIVLKLILDYHRLLLLCHYVIIRIRI